MKQSKMVRAMEHIDDSLIAEAAACQPQKHQVPGWAKWTAIAACVCLCLSGAMKLWNPGMGCSQQVRDFAEENGTLYFSTWEDGVYGWNPAMQKPQKIADTGRAANTNAGLIFYSAEEQTLWEMTDLERKEIGSFDAEALCKDLSEAPKLIGIYDGYAYWSGYYRNPADDQTDSRIVKTPLHGGTIESVLTVSDGVISAACMRKDGLYYYTDACGASENTICVFDFATQKERLLAEFETGDTGLSPEVHFMKDRILICSRETETLYQMAYTGGKPVPLADAIPTTHGFSERDGKVYYQTAFGENASADFPEDHLVSVDLASGELTKIDDFVLDNGDGTVRYTLTELAMTEGGFYFADPHAGVLYHDETTHTETEIYRHK